MAIAARQFEGEHDFTSFAASSGSDEDDGGRNMVRVIHSSELVCRAPNEEIEYVVRGQSFLRYMVRKIVGTLIEVGKGRLAVSTIFQRILEMRDPIVLGADCPTRGFVSGFAGVSRSPGVTRVAPPMMPALIDCGI